MNLKVFYVSFINLLVALAVTAANAKTRNHLTDECYEHASAFFENKSIKFEDFKIIKEDEHIYIPSTILKREGANKVEIKAVEIENKNIQNFYGLQFNWKDQSVIDCRSWYHTPLIILVETYDYYTPFLMEELNAIKVSTHDLVSCGSPCHYAEVNSVYIIDDVSYEPFSRTEISTPTYEYPSKMFIDYLTLDEVYQFMKTGDGFETFEWRGKLYKTEKLKKKFNASMKFQAYLKICIKKKERVLDNCEELYDTRGPYKTKADCKKRIYEMISDLPKYKFKFEPIGYICETGLREDAKYLKIKESNNTLF